MAPAPDVSTERSFVDIDIGQGLGTYSSASDGEAGKRPRLAYPGSRGPGEPKIIRERKAISVRIILIRLDNRGDDARYERNLMSQPARAFSDVPRDRGVARVA